MSIFTPLLVFKVNIHSCLDRDFMPNIQVPTGVESLAYRYMYIGEMYQIFSKTRICDVTMFNTNELLLTWIKVHKTKTT